MRQIPKIFTEYGIYPEDLTQESMKQALEQAKIEWKQWSKEELIQSLTQMAWAVYRLLEVKQ